MSIEQKDSLYEQLFPLTAIMKQRFVDNFSGQTLNERWLETNVTGTNVFEMADEIDGGFRITTGAGSGDNALIEFNDKRQFDVAQCEYLAVWKATAISQNVVLAGLLNNPTGGTGAVYQEMNDGAFSNFTAVSNAVQVEGTVPNDNAYHLFRCQSTLANALFSIDNVLDITGVATPTTNGQPIFRVRSTSLAEKSGQIRYFEAFNT